MLKKNQAMKLILLAGALSFPVTGMAEQMPNQPRTSISQQNGKVTGTVEDALGTVIGATVVVKGTTNGTTTDIDGRFTLEGVKKGSILQISFVGYTTKEVKYTGQSVLKIMLQEDTKTLDEVVVVGYGVQRKRDLSGSIASVKGDIITEYANTSVASALQGRVSGVQIQQTNGQPGAGIQVRVRGSNSIRGDNEPLWIINGFPGDINMINTADIESVEVMKDASATAIYGSRGANGVILITTKQAKEGKITVEYNASFGVQSLAKELELLDAWEYMSYLNEKAAINNQPTIYTDEEIKSTRHSTNWQRELFRNALVTDHSVNVSGGTEKVQGTLGTSYFDQQGIVKESGYKRMSIRSSLNYHISKYVTVSSNLIFSRSNHNQMNSQGGSRGTSVIGSTLILPPTATPHYDDGTWNDFQTQPIAPVNPLAYVKEVDNKWYANRIMANASLTIKPIDGLSIQLSANVNNNQNRKDYYKSLQYPNSQGAASITFGETVGITSNNIITYNKSFLKKHHLSVMGGFTYEQSTSKTAGTGTAEGFLSDVTETYDMDAATVKGLPTSSYSDWRLFSFLGRVNYNYADRYLLTASLRADGSSRYSKGNKWGYFPSAAVAWDIAQESFMSNQHVLDQLKLRASFGVTGNQDIAAYSTLGMLSGASYGWGTSTSSTGYWGYQFATPGITWEKTYQYDLGLDMSIGGFNITVDWFKKQTKDLLFQKQVPKYNGGGTYWVNQGKLNNTGVELSLTTFPVKGAVTWETSLNASYVKNEVADLAGDDFVLTANYSDLGGPLQIMKPGYPMGSFYVYQWKGFDDKGANLYQKADGSLTTNPTSDDLVVKGQASPKWTVGWNNTVTWKNWTLNVFFNAATGYDRLNISRFMAASMTGVSRFITLRDAYFKGWDHVANKADALYPSLTNTDNKSYANSDFWLEDASFIKLKNISLSYRIPRRVLKFASVQLSVSAQDLFTITRYKGMDPEVYTSYDGLDYGAYPIPRTITFGAKIRF